MADIKTLTEDEVRDGYVDNVGLHNGAKQILGFNNPEKDVQQGTGQITTFKQLGFFCKKNSHKPDGWYLPKDLTKVAIILETKSEDEDISKQKWVDELLINVEIANSKYSKVIGLLYNGKDIRVFKNNNEVTAEVSKTLENKSYYFELFLNDKIDVKQIYFTTKRINDLLHFKFGVNDYYDRMIFTACALVAKRYGAWLDKGRDYTTLHNSILNTLSKSLDKAIKQNDKLKILLEMYSKIQMNRTDNQEVIDEFIDCVETISDLINSNNWNGEDVMGIFFNEFNRYKGKSESGQVFTPEHIASFMYRLIEVNKDDRVLDATCGSGMFLTKSMANMIKEAGGIATKKAKDIMTNQLYGIEWDKRVYSLACANMLIHKDGKTNLEQMDSTSQEACDWIKSKNITKVLMNPPYEKKSHPEIILRNVLNNCVSRAKVAFLLPDKKLEKVSKKVVRDILAHHRLTTIIKLPEKTFDEGTTVSIFIFETGIPQNDEEIFTCYLKEDGLERVKNQGRQDVKGRWSDIEDKWVDIVKKRSGDGSIKWIKPNTNCLSYQKDEKLFEIFEEDFIKQMMEFIMYQEEIDTKSFTENLSKEVMYSSEVKTDKETKMISINIQGGGSDE
ncbi:MAG: N-6 DNA methylase [Clostridiales bacterium]|nr:N-6 DNA methylase [Clostridiales bacterium]